MNRCLWVFICWATDVCCGLVLAWHGLIIEYNEWYSRVNWEYDNVIMFWDDIYDYYVVVCMSNDRIEEIDYNTWFALNYMMLCKCELLRYGNPDKGLFELSMHLC